MGHASERQKPDSWFLPSRVPHRASKRPVYLDHFNTYIHQTEYGRQLLFVISIFRVFVMELDTASCLLLSRYSLTSSVLALPSLICYKYSSLRLDWYKKGAPAHALLR